MARLEALGAAVAPAPHRFHLPRVDRARPEGAETPRHLRLVDPDALSPTQLRRRRRLLVLAAIGAISAVAFALVYLHVVLAQRQFAIDHLNSEIQAEQQSYQNLRLQVAQLDSPEHIVGMAEKLHMQQAASVQYLTAPAPLPGAGSVSGLDGLGRHLGLPDGPSANGGLAGDADWPAVKSSLAGAP